MDSLRKTIVNLPPMPNHVAGIILFMCWYLTATVTVIILQELQQSLLWPTLIVYGLVAVFMTGLFVVSQRMKRLDVADAGWGMAFIVAAVSSYLMNPQAAVGWNAQTIVTVLVLVWGGRLAYHISSRIRSHPEEDKRYQDLKKEWRGNVAINSYLRIFLAQALLAGLISTAVIIINLSEPTPASYFVYAGLIVWVFGFIYEVVSDRQLKQFLADKSNRGKIMTGGLWKYSRHPNYFGEATIWVGIFIIGLSMPYGWMGIVTPVLITYLLLFVSGVPLKEKMFASKPGWQAYKSKTNKFIPMLPLSEND